MTTFETNALEINDLNKNYPGFSLNHLNLTLPSGCILGLIGENGAGKTTTIKLIQDSSSRSAVSSQNSNRTAVFFYDIQN